MWCIKYSSDSLLYLASRVYLIILSKIHQAMDPPPPPGVAGDSGPQQPKITQTLSSQQQTDRSQAAPSQVIPSQCQQPPSLPSQPHRAYQPTFPYQPHITSYQVLANLQSPIVSFQPPNSSFQPSSSPYQLPLSLASSSSQPASLVRSSSSEPGQQEQQQSYPPTQQPSMHHCQVTARPAYPFLPVTSPRQPGEGGTKVPGSRERRSSVVNTLQVHYSSQLVFHDDVLSSSNPLLPQPLPEVLEASSPGDSSTPLQHHEALASRASSPLANGPDTQELVQRMLQYQQQSHYPLPVDQDQVWYLARWLVLTPAPGLASAPPPASPARGASGLLLGLHRHPARQASAGRGGVAASLGSPRHGEHFYPYQLSSCSTVYMCSNCAG